jgi:hypothetical protein
MPEKEIEPLFISDRHDIAFSWSWQSKNVADLSIDGIFLDEYESDDIFVAVRDALTEWLNHE